MTVRELILTLMELDVGKETEVFIRDIPNEIDRNIVSIELHNPNKDHPEIKQELEFKIVIKIQ